MTLLTAEFEAVVAAEWERLASSGAWFTGAERVAIATEARLASDGQPSTGILSTPVEEAARRIAVEAHTLRSGDIERWADAGLDVHAFREIVGIVSRLSALDVAAFGLGFDSKPLPSGLPGESSQEVLEDTAIVDGCVPDSGCGAGPGALGAGPGASDDTLLEIHAALYLSVEQLGDLGMERDGLSRAQIELVAARTSMINECVQCLVGHAAMLRASIEHHGGVVDCAPIGRGYSSEDCGVPFANEIFAFVDSVVLGDLDEYPDARVRTELVLGRDATDRMALVAGNFVMMNRLMHALGDQVSSLHPELAAEIGVAIPSHLRTS